MVMDSKRLEAARQGLLFYASLPCRVCSGLERYVSNAKCVKCVRARSMQRYEEEARRLLEARGVAPRGAA